MNPTEIDDALRTDRRIEPSPEFRAKVMQAVHARAAVSQPHRWVGRAVWLAVPVTSVVIALLVAGTVLERSDAQVAEVSEIVRWLSFTLAGTFAMAWRSTRRFV